MSETSALHANVVSILRAEIGDAIDDCRVVVAHEICRFSDVTLERWKVGWLPGWDDGCEIDAESPEEALSAFRQHIIPRVRAALGLVGHCVDYDPIYMGG